MLLHLHRGGLWPLLFRSILVHLLPLNSCWDRYWHRSDGLVVMVAWELVEPLAVVKQRLGCLTCLRLMLMFHLLNLLRPHYHIIWDINRPGPRWGFFQHAFVNLLALDIMMVPLFILRLW